MATLNHKKQTESGTSFSAGDGLLLLPVIQVVLLVKILIINLKVVMVI
jgi:hypothetical protein